MRLTDAQKNKLKKAVAAAQRAGRPQVVPSYHEPDELHIFGVTDRGRTVVKVLCREALFRAILTYGAALRCDVKQVDGSTQTLLVIPPR